MPDTLRVMLDGVLPAGVGAKDLALEVVRTVGSDGAAYQCVEFVGPAADALPVEERMVLSNMAAEMGAKAGVFPATGAASDPREPGVGQVVVSAAELEPRVALPHDPSRGVPVGQVEGAPVDFVFLGTCTGGRAHDLREALRVLEAGGGIAPGVTVVVTPPSAAVRAALEADGTLARLAAAGAVVTETGCGPCCGTSDPLPPAGARVISTANRNFPGRMGVPTEGIWLASPATCAAAATAGRIVDPRKVAPARGTP